MQSASSKYAVLFLLGLLSVILCSCTVPIASASSSSSAMCLPPSSAVQVTPNTTDPTILSVKVAIDEDQAASDGRSTICVQFSTAVIHNPNYVYFTNGEKITCNGVPLVFDGTAYSARVGAVNGVYTCRYYSTRRTFTIVSVHARTRLLPELVPDADDPKLIVSYHPDHASPCPVKVDASDDSQTINGHSVLENGSGVYTGPNRSELNGAGTIVMTRTCSFSLAGNATFFCKVNTTYTSNAERNVTWV